jgi:hypothetical protein
MSEEPEQDVSRLTYEFGREMAELIHQMATTWLLSSRNEVITDLRVKAIEAAFKRKKA